MTLLSVENLRTTFEMKNKTARAVNGISFQIQAGESLALVGESGCGKSVTAHSILKLLPSSARHPSGKILFQGRDLLKLSNNQISDVRGHQIGMIFQEPLTALNPVYSIGNQVREPLVRHLKMSNTQADKRVCSLLEKMGLPDPQKIIQSYPHQLSGGMRQRVLIAMAMACDPKLLICDEPTTALDVTIQAQILQLIKTLQKEAGTAVLLITHDLAVVHQMCDRTAVMYSGQIVEAGKTTEIIADPKHPYTRKLIQCIPREHAGALPMIPGRVMGAAELPAVGCYFADRCEFAKNKCRMKTPPLIKDESREIACWELEAVRAQGPFEAQTQALKKRDSRTPPPNMPLLQLENMKVNFPVKNGMTLPWSRQPKLCVHAVDGVSLTLHQGETLALVGESGCGKSTLGQAILRLLNQAEGAVYLGGKNLLKLPAHELRPFRKRLQIIFQDPYGSLNPRMTVRQIVGEGLQVHFPKLSESEANEKIKRTLHEVGLSEKVMEYYPHQFSGGQRQRLAIARALVLEPEFLILDEATSALDVSLQAQILNLLSELQRSRNLTYLFITHDMGVVSYIAHQIAVMYLGRVVEYGPKMEVLKRPQHPYTQALLSAVPSFDRPLQNLVAGDIPSPLERPPGCHFHPRCQLLKSVQGAQNMEWKSKCPVTYPVAYVLGTSQMSEARNNTAQASAHWVTCHSIELPGITN